MSLQQHMQHSTAPAAAVMRNPGMLAPAGADIGDNGSSSSGHSSSAAELAMLPAEESYWEMVVLGEAARLGVGQQLTPSLLGLFNKLVHRTAAAQCAKVQPAIDMLNSRLSAIDSCLSCDRSMAELKSRIEDLVAKMDCIKADMQRAAQHSNSLRRQNDQLLEDNAALKKKVEQLQKQVQQQQQPQQTPAVEEPAAVVTPARVVTAVTSQPASPFQAHSFDFTDES